MCKWLLNQLRAFLLNQQQHRQLLAMDERARKDLAISRVDAEQLAGRFQTAWRHKLHRGEKIYV